MVSCHMLLGKPWYKNNNATHDYLANTYSIERNTKYVLVAMEKKSFKTWRKERQHKIEEQGEAKKEDKAANIFSAHIQSADHVVPIKTDSKPRTVSFKGREDDTPIVTAAQEDNAIFFVVVHQEKMEEKASLLDVPAIGSCDSMHDILTEKHLVVDELVHHGCSRIVSVLTKRYYFGKTQSHIACFILMKDFASYYYFGRSRPPEIQRSYLARTLLTWEFLCLCSTGWGPPDQIKLPWNAIY